MNDKYVNYKKLEKSRYAQNVIRFKRNGDPSIFGYAGKNIFLIFVRKIAKGIKYLRIMQDHKLYISNLAVVTSFACDLNCYGCGQHEPYLRKLSQEKRQIDMKQIKKDLKKISSVVDGIGGYALANGEGFLNQGLSELIDYYAADPKVWNMNVPTNGTVLPSEEILQKMSTYGVTATITKYDCVKEETRQILRDVLDSYGITYSTFENRIWYLHEYMEDKICDIKEAEKKYQECDRFFMLMQGRLYKCECNATGIMAGLRPENPEDSIRVEEASRKELRTFIVEKNNVSHIEACLHCRGPVGNHVKVIPAGKQMENDED